MSLFCSFFHHAKYILLSYVHGLLISCMAAYLTASPNSHESRFASCSVTNSIPAKFSVLCPFCLFPRSEGHWLAEERGENHDLSCRSN